MRSNKIEPAPLANNGQGGYLKAMASKNNSGGLARKHEAEMNALQADFEAKKAKLEHKHEKERAAKGPQPISKLKPVTTQVRKLDMSKFPKGK